MFDRLDDILIRYQQIMEELNDPDVVNDQKHFRKLNCLVLKFILSMPKRRMYR